MLLNLCRVMISTFTLNHFGIVSATCQKLRLSETIDSLIPSDPQQKVTTGQAVISMILNGLGFSNRRLYLFPQFFENKPVELLVGKGLTAKDLNDDTIGRALDRLFNYGCTELFCQIASVVALIAEVDCKFGHLDTTSVSVHGNYQRVTSKGDQSLLITFGHSKQKRPDLKQLVINLLVSADGGIPLFMQALDGNSNDTKIFRDTVTKFRKGLRTNLQEITYWVADSSFYCKETIKEVKTNINWISRVPQKITEAIQLINVTAAHLLRTRQNSQHYHASPLQEPNLANIEYLKHGTRTQTQQKYFTTHSCYNHLIPLQEKGYSYRKYWSTYGGVKQRWLIIHSVPAEERASHTVARAILKEEKKLLKLIAKLRKKEFKSKRSIQCAIDELQTKGKFHSVVIKQINQKRKYQRRGRPTKQNTSSSHIIYFVECTLTKKQQFIDWEIIKRGFFIVATNEHDSKKLSDQEVFTNYKGQKYVENGFRFLKDPLFFASSLFLKKPSRIVALTMVMCLTLLVYNIGERNLRQLLVTHSKTIKNQLKVPTQRPTLKWIFQLFEDIHLVTITSIEGTYSEVKNLRPDGIETLKMLGNSYLEKYLISPTPGEDIEK